MSRFRARKYALRPGLGADPQHLGGLRPTELLEVPQRQHLAIDRVECIQGLLDTKEPFGALGRLGRRGLPPQEHRGQCRRAGLRQGIPIKRDLQPGVPHAGAQVFPVQRGQPLTDVQPHPEQRLQFRVGAIGLQVAGELEVGLLEDVRGVEAGTQPRVHAELDHPPQPVAIAIEQLAQRPAVAGTEPLDQPRCLARCLAHEAPHTSYPRAAAGAGPKNRDS